MQRVEQEILTLSEAPKLIPGFYWDSSPRNENLNLLVRSKLFNWYFIYVVLNIKLKNWLVRTKFYWLWTGGPVLIVRTEQSFTGFGLEDRCPSWGQNKVLLALDERTGAHREDRTKFYWLWTRGPVPIVRTEQSFTGFGREDRCPSWGQNKVVLALDERTGAHREDRTKLYWLWTRGPVPIARTEQSCTGFGREDRCPSRGQNKVVLALDERTGAHREDWFVWLIFSFLCSAWVFFTIVCPFIS